MTWYKKGLRFGCTQCGQCCTGAPGYVWVSDEDIKRMAAFLKITDEEFIGKYTREIDGRLALLELPQSYDCIFLQEKKCLLYDARPKQCRTFPFWPENLVSQKAWDATARHCEGINHPDAPLIPLVEIQRSLENEEES